MAKRQSASAVKAAATEPVAAAPKWLVVTYQPVSLFSLRSTYSMSKGGKTLLVPTPYAVKMAFIDAVFRFAEPAVAEATARQMFDRIKARRVRFQPPAGCVVQNTFARV